MSSEALMDSISILTKTTSGIRGIRELILNQAINGFYSETKPDSWRITSLGEEVEIIRGITFPASAKKREDGKGLIACLRTTNVQDVVDWADLLFVPETFVKNSSQYVKKNDLLISMANSRELVGKVCLVERDDIRCTLGGFIASIRCNESILPEFLMIVLRNPVTREKLIESSTQTTNIANISLGRLRPLEIRLPTLHEQSKIVNKVAELFDRCDRLEVSLNDQEKIMNKARKSSIDSISKAVTTQDVQVAWKRIHDNWELVTETSEGIKDLRSLIIELAVKGKLSEQLKDDGNASDLLKQIQSYKNEFEKQKSKKVPASVFEPILADLPQNWIWTSLQEIGIINPRNFAEDSADAGFIPMAHISEKFSTPHSFDIRPWGEIKKGYTHVQNGDVALAKITPCFENGKSTIIDIQGFSVGAGTTEIHVVRPFIVKPEYILLFLNSPFFVFNGIPRMTGTAGQKRLPTDFFASFPFPLPPLLEQERIVERTRSLMRMCDELERNIISSAFIANQLARSVVSASS